MGRERRKVWEILVNKGDYSHNVGELNNGKDVLIPKYSYQSTEEKTIGKHVPCGQ